MAGRTCTDASTKGQKGRVQFVSECAMVRHNLRQRPHPLVCVPTTQEYRQQANKYVTSADVVLEVGSAHGVTSMLLATLAKAVVGVDCDPKMLQQARAKYTRDNLAFFFYDVLQFPTTDWQGKLLPRGEAAFSVVFVDCGGTIPVYMLAPMLEAINECVKPRLIVCKSLNLFKLQRQLTDGLTFTGGELAPPSHRSDQSDSAAAFAAASAAASSPSASASAAKRGSLPSGGGDPRSGEDNRVRRMVDRMHDRFARWMSAVAATAAAPHQQDKVEQVKSLSSCLFRVVQPHPEPIAKALVSSTAASRRKALSVLKPWRARATACGIDDCAIVRTFPATSSNSCADCPLTALLLAPGEPIPTGPWAKCASTKVRALLTRDDDLAYSKWQLFAPFSHGLPVALSAKLCAAIAALPTAHVFVEYAPGRYLDFVAQDLVGTVQTVERLNLAVKRREDGTAVQVEDDEKEMCSHYEGEDDEEEDNEQLRSPPVERSIVLGTVMMGLILGGLVVSRIRAAALR